MHSRINLAQLTQRQAEQELRRAALAWFVKGRTIRLERGVDGTFVRWLGAGKMSAAVFEGKLTSPTASKIFSVSYGALVQWNKDKIVNAETTKENGQ